MKNFLNKPPLILPNEPRSWLVGWKSKILSLSPDATQKKFWSDHSLSKSGAHSYTWDWMSWSRCIYVIDYVSMKSIMESKFNPWSHSIKFLFHQPFIEDRRFTFNLTARKKPNNLNQYIVTDKWEGGVIQEVWKISEKKIVFTIDPSLST